MIVTTAKSALVQASERLSELLNADTASIQIESIPNTPYDDHVVTVGPTKFVVVCKTQVTTRALIEAIEQIQTHIKKITGAVPLIVVPFMASAGRQRCIQAGAHWMDLSGNADISGPGLRILVEGKSNKYKRRGRPATVFAPKASRIARWLLLNPHTFATQRQIAKATGTDEGYASKIVKRLQDEGLIVRDANNTIKARDPDLLLEAWREVYRFSKHHTIRGHISARSSDTLLQKMADVLNGAHIRYAFTGLGAAWMLDQFASFRIVTVYLPDPLTDKLLELLMFREEERGANVWITVPNDIEVLSGAVTVNGIQCVHPLQAYLDLQEHPERAAEAAEELRKKHLNWNSDA